MLPMSEIKIKEEPKDLLDCLNGLAQDFGIDGEIDKSTPSDKQSVPKSDFLLNDIKIKAEPLDYVDDSQSLSSVYHSTTFVSDFSVPPPPINQKIQVKSEIVDPLSTETNIEIPIMTKEDLARQRTEDLTDQLIAMDKNQGSSSVFTEKIGQAPAEEEQEDEMWDFLYSDKTDMADKIHELYEESSSGKIDTEDLLKVPIIPHKENNNESEKKGDNHTGMRRTTDSGLYSKDPNESKCEASDKKVELSQKRVLKDIERRDPKKSSHSFSRKKSSSLQSSKSESSGTSDNSIKAISTPGHTTKNPPSVKVPDSPIYSAISKISDDGAKKEQLYKTILNIVKGVTQQKSGNQPNSPGLSSKPDDKSKAKRAKKTSKGLSACVTWDYGADNLFKYVIDRCIHRKPETAEQVEKYQKCILWFFIKYEVTEILKRCMKTKLKVTETKALFQSAISELENGRSYMLPDKCSVEHFNRQCEEVNKYSGQIESMYGVNVSSPSVATATSLSDEDELKAVLNKAISLTSNGLSSKFNQELNSFLKNALQKRKAMEEHSPIPEKKPKIPTSDISPPPQSKDNSNVIKGTLTGITKLKEKETLLSQRLETDSDDDLKINEDSNLSDVSSSSITGQYESTANSSSPPAPLSKPVFNFYCNDEK